MDSHSEQQEPPSHRFIKLVEPDDKIDIDLHTAGPTFTTREIFIPPIGKVYLFGMQERNIGDLVEPSAPAIMLDSEKVIFGKSGNFDTKYYLTNIHMHLPSRPISQLKVIMKHPKLDGQFTADIDSGHPERENVNPLEAIPAVGLDWTNLKSGISFALYTLPNSLTLSKLEFTFVTEHDPRQQETSGEV